MEKSNYHLLKENLEEVFRSMHGLSKDIGLSGTFKDLCMEYFSKVNEDDSEVGDLINSKTLVPITSYNKKTFGIVNSNINRVEYFISKFNNMICFDTPPEDSRTVNLTLEPFFFDELEAEEEIRLMNSVEEKLEKFNKDDNEIINNQTEN